MPIVGCIGLMLAEKIVNRIHFSTLVVFLLGAVLFGILLVWIGFQLEAHV
jgi:hypothetical protein